MNSNSRKRPAPSARASEISQLIKRFVAARNASDSFAALRVIDRAWRIAPENPEINALYGRLLLSEGAFDEAIKYFASAASTRAYADYEAGYISALCFGGRTEIARERLEIALRELAVASGGALARSARQLATASASLFPGWIGVGPDLQLHGEIIGQTGVVRLEIAAGSLEPKILSIDCTSGGRTTPFTIPTDGLGTGCLTARVLGKLLLGGELNFPPDFGLDGRVILAQGQLAGWISLKWDSTRPLKLTLSGGNGYSTPVATWPDPSQVDRQLFSLHRDAYKRLGNDITASVTMPDDSQCILPATPFLIRPFAAPVPMSPPAAYPAPRAIDIVIPVYAGVEDTLTCIRSVIATAAADAEIIVIEDASPDRDMASALSSLAADGAITLLRNSKNMGFPATANRGMRLHHDRDVVLLNADTEVYGDWLGRLRAAAYHRPKIATVTPLTNSGSIASYPVSEDTDLTSITAADLDSLSAEINAGTAIDIPTGVGFCLYIRRDSIDQVGYFDEALFLKGYGEENDLCLRASKAGWHHVLATDIYVRHSGSRSFGNRRNALYERNLRLLNIRYPDYDATIQAYLKHDAAHFARRRLDEARLARSGDRYVLVVNLALDGGASRAVQERMLEIRKTGLDTILLRPDLGTEGRCRLTVSMTTYDDLYYDLGTESAALTALLRSLELDHVELNHFLDFPPDLIDGLFDLDRPVDIIIHDYVWYCPRITLLDESGSYCGEPDITACQSCVDASGSRLKEEITIAALRRRSDRWLRAARSVAAPSPSVAQRIETQFPGLAVRVTPLERDIPPPVGVARKTRTEAPIKVALIGALGDHKGYAILLAMAKDAAKRRLPLEFIVIGFTQDDRKLLKTGKVFITGRYEDPEVERLIAREKPDVILFLSVFPESWCYTLTHALRARIPIAALDLGAIADRLHGTPAEDLLFPANSSPAEICDRLIAAFQSSNPEDRNRIKSLTNPNWASRPHGKPDILFNAPTLPETAGILRTIMAPTSTPPTASVSLLPLTTGLFLFSVRSHHPSQRIDDQGGISLPAMQVGVAPGVPSGQMEFMAGPTTLNGWLREPNDQIVVKVMAPSTLVLLTSILIPGMIPLEIEVKRIDVPELAAAQTAPRSLPPLRNPMPGSIRLQVVPHIQNHGDVAFGEAQWAGLVGQDVWIESFAILPLENIPPDAIEYMAVTATGVETPWVTGGGSCGTRGIGVPLTSFAVRLKPEYLAQGAICEYGAGLLSGAVAGPASNGELCRAPNDNSPIEAVWISISSPPYVPAAVAVSPPAKRQRARAQPELPSALLPVAVAEPVLKKRRSPIGPRFSVFRESDSSE